MLASIAPVRRWVCLTCQECASLTAVVTSMKTPASLSLSRSPMSSDTGKRPRKPRSPHRVHASISDRRGSGKHLKWGVRRVGWHCGLRPALLTLCCLIYKVGRITHFQEPSVFSALTTCTIRIPESEATAVFCIRLR